MNRKNKKHDNIEELKEIEFENVENEENNDNEEIEINNLNRPISSHFDEKHNIKFEQLCLLFEKCLTMKSKDKLK